jgi:hypothetical protein
VVATAVTGAAALCLAPAAYGDFGLTPTVTPGSTNAGANADVTIDIAITEPERDLRDLTIHLPPGLVGNPLAAPQCTEEQLGTDDCPDASDVGDLSNDVTLHALGGLLPIPQTVNGDVYNVVPREGEPARFGIVLRPLPIDIPPLTDLAVSKIILQSAASLRPADLGLDSVLTGLPNSATVAGMDTPIDINALSLTLSGMAGNPPKGFIRLPTSCKTHTVGFDAAAYDGQTTTAQSTFDTTNCAALPFTPEFSARIKQGAVYEGLEVSTTIAQTIDEAGLQRAQVTLPKDVTGNTTVLATQCPEASFQAGTCPPNTIVGTAMAASPLQSQPLAGPVALVDTPAGNFPDLGIDLRGALALKLKGVIGLTDDIRSQVTFDGLPDIPISDFTLTFTAASGLNFAGRDLCQPPELVFDASFLAHSGSTATVSPTATVTCTGGGDGGGGGGGGNVKKPKAKIKVGKEDSKEPTLSLGIKAGGEKLKSAAVKLPKQLGFASGKRFDQGTAIGKVTVKHTKRTLKLKTKRAVKRFAASFGDGAVKAGKGLSPRTKLIFKVKVRDASGKRTKLRVRAK